MGYLVQKTRAASLTIGGQDYTSSLIEFQVTDTSAFKNGLISTSGTLKLGQRPGGADIEDYDRNLFKRGVLVTLDVTEPGGASYRHPRGHLYVISVSYSVEAEVLEVEVGCQIALAYLTENVDAILPLVPMELDPVQQTIENCSAGIASVGNIVYQDNQGNLVSRKFFGTDSSAGTEAGAWVSVLGETALSVSPLAGAGAIPDEIELSYQVPEGLLATDATGKVETTEEISNYFLNYPATVFTRNPPPTDGESSQVPATVSTTTRGGGSTSSCGQVLTPPTVGTTVVVGGPEDNLLCSEEWTTDRVDVYLPATRTATSTTTYGAPGGQISYQEQVFTGPEIEASPGYFADKYAYCVATYQNGCNPSGGCQYYGLDTVLLGRQTTSYEYGSEANELIRTIQDTYETVLSAYQTSEWRSGFSNGIAQGFNGNLSAGSGLYRSRRVVTEYSQEDNANVQLTTTYESITSRGVGATSGSSIDALDGIRTTVKRISTTTTTLDVRPDSVNSATTSTKAEVTTLLVLADGYTTPPSEAGKYIMEESIPMPLLSDSRAEIDGWVADYSEYLRRFVRGDVYGLQVGEALRSDIVTGWYPGMPFRYGDTSNNKILAMRMDACAWGVTQGEAIVVTNGIWNGTSSGTLVIGSNLTGNSTPDMSAPVPGDTVGPGGGKGSSGSPTPPGSPAAPPSIVDDVVAESFALIVGSSVGMSSSVFTYFEDGVSTPIPEVQEFTGRVESSTVPYCSGLVVETGGLLSANGDGSVPLEYRGTLVTDTATVVNANLFA